MRETQNEKITLDKRVLDSIEKKQTITINRACFNEAVKILSELKDIMSTKKEN